MWKVFNGETLMASAALYWLAVLLILSLIDLVKRYCEQPQGHPKSRPTKPSSEAKRASCTRASAPRRLREPAVWATSPLPVLFSLGLAVGLELDVPPLQLAAAY